MNVSQFERLLNIMRTGLERSLIKLYFLFFVCLALFDFVDFVPIIFDIEVSKAKRKREDVM